MRRVRQRLTLAGATASGVDHLPHRYGPRQDQKLLTLQSQAAPAATEKKRCVSLLGFSLHANVRCAANARQGLERLCRDIARPVLAAERMAISL